MFRLRGDQMLFIFGALHAVEVGGTLDAHVVTFGGAGGEDDFFGGGADEGGYLGAGGFDDCFGFPAVGMGARVGISVGSNL